MLAFVKPVSLRVGHIAEIALAVGGRRRFAFDAVAAVPSLIHSNSNSGGGTAGGAAREFECLGEESDGVIVPEGGSWVRRKGAKVIPGGDVTLEAAVVIEVGDGDERERRPGWVPPVPCARNRHVVEYCP